MAGPAMRAPTGSAETTRTRGVGKASSMAARRVVLGMEWPARPSAARPGSIPAVNAARLSAAGLTLLVLAWVFGNPPGAAPDERAHYVRALGAGALQLQGARFEPSAAQRRAFLAQG